MKLNIGLRICTFTRSLQIEGRLDHRLTWVLWDVETANTPQASLR